MDAAALLFVLIGAVIGLLIADLPLVSNIRSVSTKRLSRVLCKLLGRSRNEGPTDTFFDLSHRLLNLEQRTFWLNLGYWVDTDDFVEACQALARKFAVFAELDGSSAVLDVGYGCGDQVLLWVDEYAVGRVDGVNISASQSAVARERIAAAGLSERVNLVEGSATELGSYSGGGYSHVLSLDSAYHYDTRAEFFREAYAALAPGGTLALADICVTNETGALPHWQRTALSLATHCPAANFVTLDEYCAQLVGVGFETPATLALDGDVFDGFPRWLSTHRAAFGELVRPNEWLRFEAVAWGLRKVAASKSLHFVLVKARKPE